MIFAGYDLNYAMSIEVMNFGSVQDVLYNYIIIGHIVGYNIT